MDERIAETLSLLKKVWTLILIALYGCGIFSQVYFPGVEEPESGGAKILWDLQKLFFFALMAVGFLVDMVAMREDRSKAFLFLSLSLILGGVSGFVSGIQGALIAGRFGESVATE